MLKSRKNLLGANSITNSISEDLDFTGTKEHRHPKSLKNCSYREKEIKVVRSVAKELSGKAFQSELKNYQPSNGLLDRQVICKADKVVIKFASPLNGISSPFYIKKWKCEDMIAEEADTNSSVVAVQLNWRKGVKVQQVSKFSRQTKLVEPDMTTTDFDFESKLKFQKHIQSQISHLFPNDDVKVLDGNECHGRVTIKSKDIQAEGYNPSAPDVEVQLNSSAQVFDDKDEHKILLVPIYSKGGFDTEISNPYSFPYHAKFIIGKEQYEHQFQLRLVPSQSPQHFGLIFSFASPDGNGYITVKSLISVYSVFPATAKHAHLVTYSNNEASNTKSENQKGFKRQFVKNVKESVSSNLVDEKLVNGSAIGCWDRNNEFSIGCTLAHPQQRLLGIKPTPYWERPGSKHKEKVNLVQNMRADAFESSK